MSEVFIMDTNADMGARLRQIRQARRKSLKAVAELAGISEGYLSRLETGERALDRRSLILDLANALEVAPSEITGSPIATLGELAEDQSLGPVRLALLAVSMGEPQGQVLPVEALSARATGLLDAQRECRYAAVGEELPALIRDLHASLAAKREVKQLLRLATLVHVQGTQAWLMDIGANMDLGWQAATLAKSAAEELDEPVAHAVSAFGTGFGLLGAGAFSLAKRTLTAPEIGTRTAEEMQLSGMLALAKSLTAAAEKNESERASALEHAAELAEWTGEGNALWFGFGPSNVGVWRMSVALEAGEYAAAAKVAKTVNPEALASPTRKAAYWREYGRALARLPKQQDAAVMMLRKAELISPARIHRHPFMRSVLSELLTRAKQGAVRRELRGMAFRAGLPA
ncbi:helix-turn-helix domain-containing protein [Allokutzneria sp. A3M-2-11 16]|uniref:helix-turn-helix domain-containing protein n=1 Tax=Allokutzneria sp. A3M-2-11 16 TaxID=2962043 RepID=UPI0020B6BF98|nr:helix-turn-helix transcriptional regulator [Allokutzneria sp. A3M-2-11 16]MCP3805360.1 helix-turn-helix domain-containing protein [Allokutzneria sp. A3M-2-11 16]